MPSLVPRFLISHCFLFKQIRVEPGRLGHQLAVLRGGGDPVGGARQEPQEQVHGPGEGGGQSGHLQRQAQLHAQEVHAQWRQGGGDQRWVIEQLAIEN